MLRLNIISLFSLITCILSKKIKKVQQSRLLLPSILYAENLVVPSLNDQLTL